MYPHKQKRHACRSFSFNYSEALLIRTILKNGQIFVKSGEKHSEIKVPLSRLTRIRGEYEHAWKSKEGWQVFQCPWVQSEEHGIISVLWGVYSAQLKTTFAKYGLRTCWGSTVISSLTKTYEKGQLLNSEISLFTLHSCSSSSTEVELASCTWVCIVGPLWSECMTTCTQYCTATCYQLQTCTQHNICSQGNDKKVTCLYLRAEHYTAQLVLHIVAWKECRHSVLFRKGSDSGYCLSAPLFNGM